MQPATILTILGLAVFTIANPVSNPEAFGVESGAEARGLEERACPTPAEVQCSRGCPAVVKKAYIRRAIRAVLVSVLLARLAVGHKSGCYKGAHKQKGGSGISVGVDKIRDRYD
ncbi:hypothetical protein V495_02506 [Pseudogymnoascus sp. VKM F-4514 (FW-929)]|nr:hypothetical protein V490_02140 [Pseudogymnoascus sp. VKM F-3557]KFY46395.1 hypothetical protein V495_02506 [Pseudogymnoascus sp. VKM F-4514 (FW-929)]KFY67790.1 hypothetical protein V497_00202 [Pseudogymnoascus sp. VKM F-4516 (FW-969)]